MKTVSRKTKEVLSPKEIDSLVGLADRLEADSHSDEDETDETIEAGLINPDPGACPNCGGDLDDGDHAFCSRF